MVTDDTGLWARLELVDDWYPTGSREPVRAWVVEWLIDTDDKPWMARAHLDVTAQPAIGDDEKGELEAAAAVIARTKTPVEPRPFGQAETGLSRGSEIYSRIELISHAIQEAQGRLHDAARVTQPWGADRVLIALTEVVGWIRALDDAMQHVWKGLSDELRSAITARIDHALERPGWDPGFVQWARSTRGPAGYSDWTLGLLVRGAGLPREDLRGMRWLAGKLLHFGPLPAAELRQWREGEAPRWKWRASAEIFPPSSRESRSHDRAAYDLALAGRDLVGTFNHFDALLSTEFLVLDLTEQPR